MNLIVYTCPTCKRKSNALVCPKCVFAPRTMVRCTRCLGTGVRTEKRRPSKRNPTGNQGFYARNCPGCGGRGEREPVTRKKATSEQPRPCRICDRHHDYSLDTAKGK